MVRLCLKSLVRLASLIFLAVLLTLNLPALPATAQEPTIFLPLVSKGITVPQPGPQPVKGAFFVQPDTKTGSAAIAVDKQGGLHLAYGYFLPDDQHPAAVYWSCLAQTVDCGTAANWSGVSMLDGVNEVQLALTPAGQPRLLVRANSTQVALGNDYFYAACDQNCVDPGQWRVIYLITTSGMAAVTTEDVNTPQRSFALDPAGRPRFVYLDNTGNPDHRGTFYAYCDDHCTDAAFWFETKISLSNDPFYEHYYYPSLAFTDSGQPRVVGDGGYLLAGQPVGIYYLACDSNCEQSGNWQRVRLFDRGSGTIVSWDLELHGGQPRLAFYEGAQLGGAGDVLDYVWCNTNCLDAAAWQRHNLGLGGLNGKHPDLELDSQGRPRLAYILQNGGGVGYGWCTGHCESAQGQWQQQVVDTATTLAQQYPVPLPSHCDAGLWDSLAPALALDPAGQPRLAYDAAYNTRCWYDDPHDNQPPFLRFWQLWHTVRVNYFPQP